MLRELAELLGVALICALTGLVVVSAYRYGWSQEACLAGMVGVAVFAWWWHVNVFRRS